jgi:hypothetical protein
MYTNTDHNLNIDGIQEKTKTLIEARVQAEQNDMIWCKLVNI